jgi:hypothetical protein
MTVHDEVTYLRYENNCTFYTAKRRPGARSGSSELIHWCERRLAEVIDVNGHALSTQFCNDQRLNLSLLAVPSSAAAQLLPDF